MRERTPAAKMSAVSITLSAMFTLNPTGLRSRSHRPVAESAPISDAFCVLASLGIFVVAGGMAAITWWSYGTGVGRNGSKVDISCRHFSEPSLNVR